MQVTAGGVPLTAVPSEQIYDRATVGVASVMFIASLVAAS